jgi:uncharacterized membrane protein
MAEPPTYAPFREPPPPPFPEQALSPRVDPVLAGFDRIVALGSYGLLFVSVFTLGVPALAAAALAIFHRDDAQPLIRSHYRFQIRIFLTALLFLILASISALLAGGLALAQLIGFIELHARQVAAVIGADTSAREAWTAGGLAVAAFLFVGLAALWTLAASAFGFLRLVANRPIGHGVH